MTTFPTTAPAAGAPAVEIRNVSMQYRSSTGPVTALSNVSLQLADGEFVALLGRSGCGKSTLLKMVAGLIKPTAGEVLVDDTPVTGPLTHAGMVFQSPVLLKWRTVL